MISIVSIIVPVYNVEPYIEDCLKSVGIQQYDGEVECIIVDDCGTDRSIDIARRYVEDYKGNVKFKIVTHKLNRGLSAARNTGIENSSGDYVYFLDSDDELYPDTISVMVNTCRENMYSDIVIGEFYCPSDPTRYYFPYCSKNSCIKGEGCGSFLFFSDYIPTNATNKLIHISLVKKYPFKEGIIHEDQLWMYQICQEVSSISFAHTPTYKRVINDNSIMETSTINRSGHNWGIILKHVVTNPPSYFRNIAIFKYLTIFLQYYSKMTQDKKIYRRLYYDFLNLVNSSGYKRLYLLLKYYFLCPSFLSQIYYRFLLKYIFFLRNSIISAYRTD